MFLAAVIQMQATSNIPKNIDSVSQLIGRAANYGAQFIATPENTNYLGPHSEKVALAETMDGPTVSHFAKLAKQHSSHILIGSFNEKSDDPNRCYNTSVLLSPQGDILGSYRKIHLFDANMGDAVSFTESDTVKAGTDVVVVKTALGNVGLSVCYDLRFPNLYSKLVKAGAEIISVPSAFTLHTGKDHWHALLRGRAIETQSFVLAPGQYGLHDDQGLRHSYGHSMIVDPWGHIIGMAPDGPSIALAEIDLNRVKTIRKALPVSQHTKI